MVDITFSFLWTSWACQLSGSCPALSPASLSAWGWACLLYTSIYALDACGCLNKGTVDIQEIVAYFEYVFDIDLGDFYHTYMELKAKTKDRTGFLSTDVYKRQVLYSM